MPNALVKIKNGLHEGRIVDGTFKIFDINDKPERGSGYDVKVEMDGLLKWVNITSASSVEEVKLGVAVIKPSEAGILTEIEVANIIEERFEVLDALTLAMLTSNIKSLLIFGAAGIGKTFNVTSILEAAERKGQHWGVIGGKCSPFGLFSVLYEYRNEGSILVLDDVDVFEDETQINLLKKALDSNKRRIIDWRSASKVLADKGLPDTFEFKGKVIFLSNTNIYSEIARGTKRAPHLEALVSRSCVLDLGIHDVKTILIHVRTVIRRTNMIIDLGLTHKDQEDVINYLTAHRDELAALSLRTPLAIAEFMKHDYKRWRIMCNHTLLAAKPLIFKD